MSLFSPSRFQDSQRAHIAAQTQFYPRLFYGLPLTFDDVTKTAEDLDYAIDVQVSVTVDGLRAPLRFAIQERWRTDLTAMRYDDLTITEWNLDTDLPSELHKLGAHLFVYGFYDKAADRIIGATAASVPRILLGLLSGQLPYDRRLRRFEDQSFITLQLDHLRKVNALLYKMPSEDGTA
jgi:hypothetical protein